MTNTANPSKASKPLICKLCGKPVSDKAHQMSSYDHTAEVDATLGDSIESKIEETWSKIGKVLEDNGLVPSPNSDNVEDILEDLAQSTTPDGEYVILPRMTLEEAKAALLALLEAEAIELPVHSDMYGPFVPLERIKELFDV